MWVVAQGQGRKSGAKRPRRAGQLQRRAANFTTLSQGPPPVRYDEHTHRRTCGQRALSRKALRGGKRGRKRDNNVADADLCGARQDSASGASAPDIGRLRRGGPQAKSVGSGARIAARAHAGKRVQ